MSKSLFSMFGTERDLEANGIVVDYGPVRVRVARAGGSNQAFKKVFAQLSKPYRRQIDNEQLSDEAGERLMAEVYARSVILGWESRKTDDKGEYVDDKDGQPIWERVIVMEDGSKVEVTPENVQAVLLALPELFADIKVMAQKASNYQRAELEADAGN